VLSLTSSWALAQETDVKRVELKKGDKAPFDGQLLSNAAVAKLLSDQAAKIKELEAKLTYLQDKSKTDLEAEQKSCAVKVDAEKAKTKLCDDTRKAEAKVYTSAVDRVGQQCERKWYESPYIHLVLGLGAGIGGCALAK
jgi:hypothetical protein